MSGITKMQQAARKVKTNFTQYRRSPLKGVNALSRWQNV